MPELIVVFVALVVATTVVLRVVARPPRPDPAQDLGRHVMIGVASPTTATVLSGLGAALARGIRGRVTPFTVVPTGADEAQRAFAEEAVRRGATTVVEEGLAGDPHLRVDVAVADGLLHGVVQLDASLLVMGWPATDADGRFAAPVEQLVSAAPLPVLVARLDGHRWHRIVLRVPREPMTAGLRASLRAATQASDRLADARGLDVSCVADDAPVVADPSQVVISPVAPEPAAIRRAAGRVPARGDVILAICHGPRATEHRPLLSAAVELYDQLEVPDRPMDLAPRTDRVEDR